MSPDVNEPNAANEPTEPAPARVVSEESQSAASAEEHEEHEEHEHVEHGDAEKRIAHAASALVEQAKPWMARAARAMKKPAIGAAVAGGTVVVAAALWGVAEAAIGALAAFAVYRSLQKRRSRSQEPRAQSGNATEPRTEH